MNINDFNNNTLLSISQSSTTSFTNLISSSYLFLNNIDYGIKYENNALQITANSNLITGDVYINGKLMAKEYASNVVILDHTNKIPVSYIPTISSNIIINNNTLNGIGTTEPLTRLHLKDGDLLIQNGRLGIGTIPSYYCHINKNDNNTGMPAFVITSNNKHVFDIYSEKGIVIINDDGSLDNTIINSNIKLQVFGTTKTTSLITNDLYINKIYSNSNNKIEIHSNIDLILSNISIGNSLSNLTELKTKIDEFLYENKDNKNNLIVSNLTLLNYDSLTSNPIKESVFDIKGKIKLYNDTENIIKSIYTNDDDFYFITTNNKLYKNLILNIPNLNFQFFKSKYNNYGYYNNNTTVINTDTSFLINTPIKDFSLTTSPTIIFYINDNNKIFKFNKTDNTTVAITDPNDINRNYIKIDTYKTPEDTFIVLSSSLYFYSSGVFQLIEFPISVSILDFSCGNNHTLVLTSNGVWSFGSNENNITLKKGYTTSETSLIKPEKIILLNSYKIIKIKAYGNSSIVLDENGNVFIFGTINSNYQQSPIYNIPNIPRITEISCNNNTLFLLSYFGDLYTLNNDFQPIIMKLSNEFYGVSIKSRGSIAIGGNNFNKQPPRNSLLVENYVAIGSNINTYDNNYSLVVSGNINLINGNIYNNGVLFNGTTTNPNPTIGNNYWEKNNTHIYYPGGNVGIGIINPLTKLHVNGSLTIDNDIYLGGKIISSEYKPIVINEPKNIYYNGKFGINIKKPETNLHLYNSTFRITDIIPEYKLEQLSDFTCNIINTSFNTSYFNPIKISENSLTVISSFYNNEINDNNNNNSNVHIYKYFNNKWNSFYINDIPNGNTCFGESISVSTDGSVIFIGAYKQKIITNTTVIQTGGIYKFSFNNNNQLIKENLETILINPNTNNYYYIGKNICCSGDGNVIISTIVNDNNKLFIKKINDNIVNLLDYNNYTSTFHSSFNNNTTVIDSSEDGSTIVINFTYDFSNGTPIANFNYFNIYIIHNYKNYLLRFNNNNITNSEVISVSINADGSRIFINTKSGYHFIYDIYELDFYNYKISTNFNYIDIKPNYFFYKENDIDNDYYKGKISKSGNLFILFNSKKIFIYKNNLTNTNIWEEEEFLKDIHLTPQINNYSVSLDYNGYNYAISYIKKLQDTNITDEIKIINNIITKNKERVAVDFNNNNSSLNINVNSYFNSNLFASYFYGDGSNITNIQLSNIITTYSNINTNGSFIYTSNNHLYYNPNIIWSNNLNSFHINNYLYVNSNIYTTYGNITSASNIIATSNIYTTYGNITSASNIIANSNIYANSNLYVYKDLYTNFNINSVYGSIIAGVNLISKNNIYTSNNGILKTSGVIISGSDIISTSNIYTCNNGILKTSGVIISGTDIISTSNIYTCNNGMLKTSGVIISGTDIISSSNIYTCNNGILKTSGVIISGTDIISTSNIYTCNNCILKTSGVIISGTDIISTSNIYTCNNGMLKSSGVIISETDIISSCNIYTCNNGMLKTSGVIISGSDITSSSNIYTCNNGMLKTSGVIISGTDIISTSNIYTCNNGMLKTSGVIISGTDIISTSNIYTCNNGMLKTSGVIISGTDIISSSNIYTCNNGILKTSGVIISGSDIISSSNIYTCNNGMLKTSGVIISGTDIISTSNIYTCNNGMLKTSGVIISGTDIISSSNIYTCNNGMLKTSGVIISGTDITSSSNIYTCNNGMLKTSGVIISGTDIIVSSNIYTCNNGMLKTSGVIISGSDIYTCNNGILKTSGVIISETDIYSRKIIADGSELTNINSASINGIIPLQKGGLGIGSIPQYNLIYANQENSLSNTSKLQWNEDLNIFTVDGEIITTTIQGNGFNITSINPANINGILNISKGGTGKNVLETGEILIGNGLNPVIQSPSLIWDNTNGRLGINSSLPKSHLDINGIINCSNIIIERGLEPGYDTDWQYVNLTADVIITYTHNLNVYPRNIELWFSPTNPPTADIFPVKYSNSSSGTRNPINISVNTTDVKLYLSYSLLNLYEYFDTTTTTWISYTEGYYRVYLYK